MIHHKFCHLRLQLDYLLFTVVIAESGVKVLREHNRPQVGVLQRWSAGLAATEVDHTPVLQLENSVSSSVWIEATQMLLNALSVTHQLDAVLKAAVDVEVEFAT